jgi:hypothetical protein
VNIFFSTLSVAYITGIFLLADSSVVSDMAAFNPYSLLHIPLYGILTLLLILSFFPQRNRFINSTNSIDPINSKNPIDPTNSINPSNSTNSSNLIVAGIIALVVAIADEIHQAYIPNRNASVIDVLLDSIGIILFILFIPRSGHLLRFLRKIT